MIALQNQILSFSLIAWFRHFGISAFRHLGISASRHLGISASLEAV